MDIWIWAAVIVVTLVLEFVTAELIGVWFSIAGLVSLVLAILNVEIWIQVVVFSVVSLALLLGLRKVCMKLLKNTNEKTNSEAIVGSKQTLLTSITKTSLGTVKINGVVWNVASENNSAIKSGTEIEILEIKGNKLIAKKGE